MKKVLSLALAMVLCFSLTVSASAASRRNFSDVPSNAYYATPVLWAVENGITAGTGDGSTFSPDATCTTAQILTFLWRSQSQPEPTIQNPYSDVKSSDYYYKAALWAHEKGLVGGAEFNGDTACTRSATVTYLWKLAGSPSASSAAFTDVPQNANYAKAVAWAVSKNITAGTSSTTFSPDTTCTRGQIVTFLYRNLTGEAPSGTADGQGLAYYGLKPAAALDVEYPYTTSCYDDKSMTTTGTVKFTDYTRKSLGNGYDELSISIVYTFSDDAANSFGYSYKGGSMDYYLYTDDEETADDLYANKAINWNGNIFTDCSASHSVISGGWNGNVATEKVVCTAKIPAGYDGYVVTAYAAPSNASISGSIPLLERNNLVMFRCA